MFVINRPNYVLSVFMDIDVKNWHNKTIELQNISCGRSTNDEAERTSISIGNYQQGNRAIVSPMHRYCYVQKKQKTRKSYCGLERRGVDDRILLLMCVFFLSLSPTEYG